MRCRLILAGALLAVLVLFSTSGCRAAASAIAVVNGEVISEEDFRRVVSARTGDTAQDRAAREQLLEQLIRQKLVVQRARALGYEETLKGALEKRRYELLRKYLQEYAQKLKPTRADIALESLLFITELHLKVMQVPTWDTAQMVENLIRLGVPFESLAVRYNRSRLGDSYGDIGWNPAGSLPLIWFRVAQQMKPGQASSLIVRGINYEFIKLEDRRIGAWAESIALYRPQIEAAARQRKGTLFLDAIRAQVEYDEEVLDRLTSKPESLGHNDMPRVVARRADGYKVRVDGLLPIVQRYGSVFAYVRRKALKEDIENDLLEREALRLKLDQTPQFQREYRRLAEGGIYQYFYQRAVTDRAQPTEAEIRAEYEKHPELYGQRHIEEVADHIRNQLIAERRQKLYEALIEELRQNAKIVINRRRLMQVEPTGGA